LATSKMVGAELMLKLINIGDYEKQARPDPAGFRETWSDIETRKSPFCLHLRHSILE
jgi:hypothetical protein